jgi:hypothetical protein
MPAQYRHPQYDLSQSIETVQKITDRGAGATVSMDELAAFLGYSGARNGAYLNRLSAARLFGLLEGPPRALAATERAEQIIHPDYPQTEERARLEAFHSVPLYSAFFEAFGRRELPEDHHMLNTLISRFGVPAKEAKSVLARLMASADQAGLFKVAGPTRMIEPTTTTTPSPSGGKSERVEPATQEPTPRARFPKIIDGALDLMPAGPPWEEAEYVEWLAFFDQACRVYYRIARGGKAET